MGLGAEVVFVNGNGGALVPGSGAAALCRVPLPDNENVKCEGTGSREDLLPGPVPVIKVGTAAIEEFPADDRAVVDGKTPVEFPLTPEPVGPGLGAIKVDEFPTEDGEFEAVTDAAPVAPLDVASGTLSVGLGTDVEE